MNGNVSKTIYRKNYKAPHVIIDSLSLRFDLEEDETRVESTMRMKNMDINQPLMLMGEALELIDVLINGERLEKSAYRIEEGNLIIQKTPEAFELRVYNKINPKANTALSGLYRTHDLFCTQCEAEGFRRITYFLDRPDVLTKYTTTIVADKEKFPILLSNGNCVEEGELDNNRHFVRWEDPFKKPSYLFALVAGNLACIEDTYITMSGRKVTLQIYVEHGNEDKCEHAMVSLKKAMKWDEEVYGREYDLDIFMIVAVSDFNMGAMENKGLNVFNAKYILARSDTATDEDFAGIEGVVAHEYFHNWTGNRVTCRDWFQLSLKEGLTVFRDQEFSRDMNSRDVNRIEDVKILRAHQFPEDAGPMAHPVRPDEYIEINNFYTATVYNKGAEVIRMQHTCLGAEKFRKGMDLYFERHDGQAVTIDDFVAAMEDANDIDFTQLKRWYAQSGTPEVSVKTDYHNGQLSLTLSQFCLPTPGQENKLPFYIPIKFSILSDKGVPYKLDNDILVLNEETQTYVFNNLNEGAVISLLRDFSAPIKLHFNQNEQALRTLIQYESDGFARFEAMQRLLSLTMSGLMDAIRNNEPLNLTDALSHTFLALLEDTKIDLALKALMLQPLSFEAIVGDMKEIDVGIVLEAMDYFVKEVGVKFESQFKSLYSQLEKKTTTNKDAGAFGIRKLKNRCLSYLKETDNYVEIIQKQFETAKTMSDELCAFHLLAESDIQTASKAIDTFYKKWQADELVLDKWFTIQAVGHADATLERVKELMSNDAFQISNPNKVRALIGAFSNSNPRHFHTEEGVDFLRDCIQQIDKLNPQTASRLVMPLTRWRRYNEHYRQPMKKALETLLATGELSKDVAEVVSKSI
jgi:aminopeptidase N